MKSKKSTRLISAILLVSLVSIYVFKGCKSEEKEPYVDTPEYQPASMLVKPEVQTVFSLGDTIPYKITFNEKAKTIEKVVLFIDGKQIYSTTEAKGRVEFSLNTDTLHIGVHKVSYQAFVNGQAEPESNSSDIFILSDIKPQAYTYRIKNTFTHDVNAYTQGLYFEDGNMYEGTGQNGRSELRLVDFRQGKVLRSIKLDNSIFGEGVTVVGDKVYQLSWQNKKGFVYDKSTFKQLQEFTYPTEGWGLTYDGTDLILSDGTYTLYFYDPTTFALKRKVEVADNATAVGMLNELEYINGEVWANVYQTDYIVRIDPKTGKVTGKINCGGLLTEDEKMSGADVLNGIAYDPATKKIYITGKLWPHMFEIELVENNLAMK